MITLKIINHQSDRIYAKILQPKAGTTRSEYLIGRHPSCGLVLDTPEVSRIHGRILFQDGSYYYSDLGSTDGSRINNIELITNQKYRLHTDDMIRVGNAVILVEDLAIAPSPQETHSELSNAWENTWKNAWATAPLNLRCIQIIDQTHDVKTFRFVVHEPKHPVLFQYKPGQFITLDLEINHKRICRSYSISSSPSRPQTLDITVKRIPDGLVSNWLHVNLKVGAVLKVKEPMGQFTCVDQLPQVHEGSLIEQQPTKLLFISAGSGITPMMSMAQWICDTAAIADVIFFHSAHRLKDFIFRSELALLNQQHPQFKLAVTLTDPDMDWMGYTGRINAAMLQAIAPDFSDRLIYVCGSTPFMETVKAILTALNLPMAQYFEESFGDQPRSPQGSSSSATKDAAAVEAQARDTSSKNQSITSSTSGSTSGSMSRSKIVFTESQQEITCDNDEVILDVAERAGISLKSGCRMGVCGVCKQRVLEGSVNYVQNPAALKAKDQHEGLILPCIACPVDRVVICA